MIVCSGARYYILFDKKFLVLLEFLKESNIKRDQQVCYVQVALHTDVSQFI